MQKSPYGRAYIETSSKHPEEDPGYLELENEAIVLNSVKRRQGGTYLFSR